MKSLSSSFLASKVGNAPNRAVKAKSSAQLEDVMALQQPMAPPMSTNIQPAVPVSAVAARQLNGA